MKGILLPIVVFSLLISACARKEISKVSSPVSLTAQPSIHYVTPYYRDFITFLSNSKYHLGVSYVTTNTLYFVSLTNEFAFFSLDREKRILEAINGYSNILSSITDEEEITFFRQRIGVSYYKLKNYDASYKMLSQIYSWMVSNGRVDNELFYYLALLNLTFKKDAQNALKFLTDSEPFVSTLEAMDYYYFCTRVALLAGKKEEARKFFRKAYSIDRGMFKKKYGDEVSYYFPEEEFFSEKSDNKNLEKLILENRRRKLETFTIELNLSPLFEKERDILYFYSLPASVYRPYIRDYREIFSKFVTNNREFYSAAFCFYNDRLDNDKYSYLLVLGSLSPLLRKSKSLPAKETRIIRCPAIIFVGFETNLSVIETNTQYVSNSILTNVQILTNVSSIILPFEYLWKIQKIELNNDEYWDYLFVGINNKKNEAVFSVLDGKTLSIAYTFTNNIDSYRARLYIQDVNGDDRKEIVLIDEKFKIFEVKE